MSTPANTSHAKLLASDLLSLTVHFTSPPFFSRFHCRISHAETLGIIVSRQLKPKFLQFLLDDGSGCIPCVLWLNHRNPPPSGHDTTAQLARQQAEIARLGEVVRVRGRLSVYRGVVQITVRDLMIERDPNMEVLHWLDCIRLAKQCYDLR